MSTYSATRRARQGLSPAHLRQIQWPASEDGSYEPMALEDNLTPEGARDKLTKVYKPLVEDVWEIGKFFHVYEGPTYKGCPTHSIYLQRLRTAPAQKPALAGARTGTVSRPSGTIPAGKCTHCGKSQFDEATAVQVAAQYRAEGRGDSTSWDAYRDRACPSGVWHITSGQEDEQARLRRYLIGA